MEQVQPALWLGLYSHNCSLLHFNTLYWRVFYWLWFCCLFLLYLFFFVYIICNLQHFGVVLQPERCYLFKHIYCVCVCVCACVCVYIYIYIHLRDLDRTTLYAKL